MAGVPAEILLSPQEDYAVSYAPSGTLLAWLRANSPATKDRAPPSLLALADPAFAAPEDKLPGLILARRGNVPDALPGTRREVQAIAQLFQHSHKDARIALLQGRDASEQQLGAFATAGKLAQYRYLHLATHGVADSRRALQSALVLAQDDLPDPLQQVMAGKPVYDGRLTAEQILRTWNLDAELVVLSACESALGKPGGGEGYLGFAQALFLAGARSLVLSLWKVDDTATALLMTRFYQNLLGHRDGLKQPLPKAMALQEAKRWLQRLPQVEVKRLAAQLPAGPERVGTTVGPRRDPALPGHPHPYAHPYYWAAFILIGDRD